MSDVSVVIDDLIGLFHGKRGDKLAPDAKKLLDDVEAVVAGLSDAGPYAPAILSDVASLTAEATALAASKGLDLPELIAGAASLKKTAADLAAAEKAFLDGMAAFKASAATVATAGGK